MSTRVSIILPCRNEELFIAACLDSIVATQWPHHDLELIVVDGASDDGTRRIVEAYARRHGWIRLLDNPRRIVPVALNIAIAAATGDVILRMDAHALYPPEYVPRLVQALAEGQADNVGGTITTVPGGRTHMARAIAIALAHPFGVGNSHFRIGTKRPRLVDTVPYGCYRRAIFERLGMFDEEMVRNQDDEFNHRLRRAGGRSLLLPEVRSSYFCRPRLAMMARMQFQYGRFKPLVARKVGSVITPRQLVPPAFVLSLLGGAALAPLLPAARHLWLAMLALYAGLALLSALPTLRRHGWRTAAALLLVFLTLHLSYGTGFLLGLRDLSGGPRPAWRDPLAVPLTR